MDRVAKHRPGKIHRLADVAHRPGPLRRRRRIRRRDGFSRRFQFSRCGRDILAGELALVRASFYDGLGTLSMATPAAGEHARPSLGDLEVEATSLAELRQF